jgi:drug/metabolite transporter (DMT)-like permease
LGEGGGTSLKGDLLVVIATVCWGSYAVLSLPLLRRHPPLVVAAYTLLFGGLAVAPLACFYAWQRGVSRVGANRVLVYQYLITFVGVASGVVLLGEGLTAN